MKQIKTILLTILMISAAIFLPGCSSKTAAPDHCCCCEQEVITEVIKEQETVTEETINTPVAKDIVYE